MADEVKPGEMPTPEGETPKEQNLDIQAELEKTRAALKEANREAAERRKKLEAYEAAEKAKAEAEMTEAEKLKAELKAASAELKKMQRIEMRRAAAERVGLDPKLASRLEGETLEDLETDAKALLEALPKAPKNPAVSPTNPGGATKGETIEEQRARIHGWDQSIWDPAVAKRMGGGVRNSEEK